MHENDSVIAIGVGDLMSLYDEIGGDAAIADVVDEFWHRVSSDESLWPWFSAIDSDQLKFHLRAYLTVAFDGPEQYQGRSMRHSHAGLKVTGVAFDRLLARLGESLVAIGTIPETVSRVDARLQVLRPVIVERNS